MDLKKASRYAIIINAVQIAAAAAIALLVLFTDLEQRAGWRYVSALVCVSALLVVCGGGHVGTCVLRAAKLTGFELWLFDDRPQEAVAEAAALADRFFPVAGDFYEGIAAQAVSPGAFFVICGHSHTQDGEALHAALEKDAAYVGMLGSRRKIAALFERLRSLGVPQAQLDTVCTPIGFDLGGETPEELAIAILAQILLVKNRGRQALTDAKEDKA